MDTSTTKEVVKFRADSVLRRAIKIRAAYYNINQEEAIVKVLKEALAKEIKDVEQWDSESERESDGSKSKTSPEETELTD